MNVPAPPARMELSVSMDLISTLVNVPKVYCSFLYIVVFNFFWFLR